MKKLLGIFGLLVVVFAATAIANPQFVSAYNLQNLITWTSLFGIISIGGVWYEVNRGCGHRAIGCGTLVVGVVGRDIIGQVRMKCATASARERTCSFS